MKTYPWNEVINGYFWDTDKNQEIIVPKTLKELLKRPYQRNNEAILLDCCNALIMVMYHIEQMESPKKSLKKTPKRKEEMKELKNKNDRIITIDQLSNPHMFALKEFLLGDKNGKYVVVTEEGLPLGRYNNHQDAQDHLNSLLSPNDPILSKLSTKDLIDGTNELLKELSYDGEEVKLFKYDNQGNEAFINLEQVVSFTIEKPSEYGTSFFLVLTTAGLVQLNSKDMERFLIVIEEFGVYVK